MNKVNKITVFLAIIIVSLATILLKQNIGVKENVHVVSKSEEERKDTPQNQNLKTNEQQVKPKKKEKESTSNEMITIFISGEVKEPGVVTIEGNKRLSDAIDKLGGFTSEANLNKINLAMKIEDEKHYIIPKIGEDVENTPKDIDESKSVESKSEDSKININTANIQELDELPGVGEATANKIISYRDEKGKFNNIEEIKNVNGIGDKKYEDIKEMININ
ncbi:helix-hairpin-helix domain-containing protein [Romboutsia sedimentorum]|uniref:Helix-hairpin-helix domain-containing protein n=1 Tax=Romboutsia sedimentorum TaxID=1368474 RepID=A0ABT7E804_9FIRM|nr:helix-hairpin-helix domain-containing protein [Romboutsia sedimentorum]MDK2562822.1 helix-hairpin-helix domain-containing protein [Romboutsia sedimentorum]MDK2585695.1 helix-hairpin-helix domain-containing protein [Romboutsia sedimentorum]